MRLEQKVTGKWSVPLWPSRARVQNREPVRLRPWGGLRTAVTILVNIGRSFSPCALAFLLTNRPSGPISKVGDIRANREMEWV